MAESCPTPRTPETSSAHLLLCHWAQDTEDYDVLEVFWSIQLPPAIRTVQYVAICGRIRSRILTCKVSNPSSTEQRNVNFQPFEVVSRYRDPQLQVTEN